MNTFPTRASTTFYLVLPLLTYFFARASSSLFIYLFIINLIFFGQMKILQSKDCWIGGIDTKSYRGLLVVYYISMKIPVSELSTVILKQVMFCWMGKWTPRLPILVWQRFLKRIKVKEIPAELLEHSKFFKC